MSLYLGFSFVAERTYYLLSVKLDLLNNAVSTVLITHGCINVGCHEL
jgi:hypothetical protein